MKKLILRILDAILPQSTKRSLVHLSFNIERDHFQYMASKYLYAPDMRAGLKFLASLGFEPRTILDIGAFEGNWAKLSREIWPKSKTILVEANEQKVSMLKNDDDLKNADVIQALLGAVDGETVEFTVMESGSSVFEERSPVPRHKVQVVQRTLDSLPLNSPRIDFIKIDVQGYEINVLKGAKRVLIGVEAVLLEISLIEINRGAPLFSEVVNFMESIGFVTFDVFEIHRRPLDGVMNQLDLLFLREGSHFRADKRHCA